LILDGLFAFVAAIRDHFDYILFNKINIDMLDYQKRLTQRRSHAAPRLFATDHAPMIATFFHRSFGVDEPPGRLGLHDRDWPRKHYPQDQDDPRYELTSSAEQALEWLHGLVYRRFIGTESRMKTVFGLLKRIIDDTELNPARELPSCRNARPTSMPRSRRSRTVISS
jgi:hypothetical protein